LPGDGTVANGGKREAAYKELLDDSVGVLENVLESFTNGSTVIGGPNELTV
jgi:hypothetical protein